MRRPARWDMLNRLEIKEWRGKGNLENIDGDYGILKATLGLTVC